MKWKPIAEIETTTGARNKKTGELERYTISKSDTGIWGCNCKSWIFTKVVNGQKVDCKHLRDFHAERLIVEAERTIRRPAGYVNGEAMDDLTKADYEWMYDIVSRFACAAGRAQTKSKCLRWLKTKLDTPLEQAAPIQPQLDFRIKRMITLEE